MSSDSKSVSLPVVDCRSCPKAGPSHGLRLNPSKAKVLTDLGGTVQGQIAACLALKDQLQGGVDVIHLPPFVASPSKGSPRRAEGVILYRDKFTEDAVAHTIARHSGSAGIAARLKAVDPTASGGGGALYSAGRVLAGEAFTRGDNFFLFGPDVFMLESTTTGNHMSFEFLSASEALLAGVATKIQTVFGPKAAADWGAVINPSTAPFTVAGAATAHETGHKALPVRVIPERDERTSGLSTFMFDTLGELAADAVGNAVYGEVFGPRLPMYTHFYRIFGYSSMAFDLSGIHGANADNDALAGAISWSFMEATGGITYHAGEFQLDLSRCAPAWAAILKELTKFLTSLVQLPKDSQDAAARAWVSKYVPCDAAGRYAFPTTMALAFHTSK